ncbi:MAG: hypothetical protein ACOYKD_09705 [Anaerolineaceae bacterium]|jgi:hypothetical protein
MNGQQNLNIELEPNKKGLTSRGKIALFSLLAYVIIFLVLYILLRKQLSQSTNPEAYKLWGAFFIKFLAFSILATVLVTLLVKAFNPHAADLLNDITDELDRLIELRTVKCFTGVFAAGFFLDLFTLMLWGNLNLFFHLLALSMFAAGAAFYLLYMIQYERGY